MVTLFFLFMVAKTWYELPDYPERVADPETFDNYLTLTRSTWISPSRTNEFRAYTPISSKVLDRLLRHGYRLQKST